MSYLKNVFSILIRNIQLLQLYGKYFLSFLNIAAELTIKCSFLKSHKNIKERLNKWKQSIKLDLKNKRIMRK
jgi:hypothetical protein